jgi:hypothetical protein
MISAWLSRVRMASTAEIPAAPLPIIRYLRMLHLPTRYKFRLKQVAAFKTEYPARAAGNTFTAGQAVALTNGFSLPGIPADVDPNGAGK